MLPGGHARCPEAPSFRLLYLHPRALPLSPSVAARHPPSSPDSPIPPRVDPIPAPQLEELWVLVWIFLSGSEPKAFLSVSTAAVGKRAQLIWSDLALVIICHFSGKITPFQLWIHKQ